MDINKLEKRLMKEFFDHVKGMDSLCYHDAEFLGNVGSILSFLWHPATKSYIEQHHDMSKADMFVQAAVDAARGVPGADEYLKHAMESKQ